MAQTICNCNCNCLFSCRWDCFSSLESFSAVHLLSLPPCDTNEVTPTLIEALKSLMAGQSAPHCFTFALSYLSKKPVISYQPKVAATVLAVHALTAQFACFFFSFSEINAAFFPEGLLFYSTLLHYIWGFCSLYHPPPVWLMHYAAGRSELGMHLSTINGCVSYKVWGLLLFWLSEFHTVW